MNLDGSFTPKQFKSNLENVIFGLGNPCTCESLTTDTRTIGMSSRDFDQTSHGYLLGKTGA